MPPFHAMAITPDIFGQLSARLAHYATPLLCPNE
jgi:hypothetical protein